MHGDAQWGVPGYSSIRELGSGSAGRVVLARRDHDGAEVAVKYLSDELRADVGFVARFRHEARLLGTLRSPHNARLIDYVETGAGAAIIMELVNGVSLREVLRSEGPTGPEAALVVLKGSLQGLAAAHAIGVVHRDFKPENVIVQGDGTSKLVDYGIAVRAGEDASAAGTPPYMAPEQWSGAPAAPSTDVYAATIVFFECLTGTRPYRAPNLAALARQHQSAPPPVEEVPGPLQGLVERGLAKDPIGRPPSAEAFLTELEAIATEAYGADWEQRGRRRLARLAGLLLVLFPSAPDAPPEVQTSLAETHFRTPSKLLSKLSSKVLIGTACAGVVITAAVVTVGAFDDDTTLRAQTSQVTPSTVAPFTGDPVTEEPLEEPVEEPTPSAEETTPEPTPEPPTPEPTTSTSAAPPPMTSSSPTPRPSRTRTPKPTPTATETTGKPATTSPVITGTLDEPPTTATQPTATPTTAAPPTFRPPTRSPGTPAPEPTPTRTGDDGGEITPTPVPEDEGPGRAAATLLAVGLVTSGAVPVTLAVKRRMAGRHRRKS
ncbi:protein kinase [Nonomuraea sp. NPDC048916]|uniref:serine/threonine-protein kinase n=1 Tax=Nonomuraea sp. NPDC048916 TaxID=3154232 RepID=UPI003405553D